MKIFVCIFVLAAVSVGGCAPMVGRVPDIEGRERDVAEAVAEAQAGKPGAIKQLMQIYRERADNGGLGSKFDAIFVNQVALRGLLKRCHELKTSGQKEKLLECAQELRDIDPQNSVASSILDEMKNTPVLFEGVDALAPTSRAARLRNRLLLSDQSYYGDDGATLVPLMLKKLKEQQDYMVPIEMNVSDVALMLRAKMGLDIHFHSSVPLNAPFSENPPPLPEVASATQGVAGERGVDGKRTWLLYSTPLAVLGEMAKRHGINFVLFQSDVYAFRGENVPEDIDGGQYVSMLRSEFIPLASAVAAIRAVVGPAAIVSIDEPTRTIWVRGTRGTFLRAYEALTQIDVPEAEVNLELEIFEIQSQALDNIGLRLPQLLKLGIGSIGSPGVVSVTGFTSITKAFSQAGNDTLRIMLTDPAVQAEFNAQKFYLELMGRPQIRLQDGQRGKIYVGDRIPVITTTASTSGFVTENINYVDSGLKLEVGVRVVGPETVSVDLNVESTNFTKTVTSQNGTSAPQLGTRQTTTRLTLENGRTAIVSGLISVDDRRTHSGYPILGLTPFAFLGGYRIAQGSTVELLVMLTPTITRGRQYPSRSIIAGGGPNAGATNVSVGAVMPLSSSVGSIGINPAAGDISTGKVSPSVGPTGGAMRGRRG